MLALIGEINDALAAFAPKFVRDPAKIAMRIYRDTRFSKNKLPYKTNLAAWWARHGMEKTSGGGFYLSIGIDQITVAAGCYMPAPEQLLAIRRHLQTHHAAMRALLAIVNCTLQACPSLMTPRSPARPRALPRTIPPSI